MKPLLTIISFLMSAMFIANAQIPDQQVISIVKEGIEAGKSKTDIGRELLSRGVPAEQISRLVQMYSAQPEKTTQASVEKEQDRTRKTLEIEPAPQTEHNEPSVKIFGHDIFTVDGLSFEPNENAATPADYVLGPGDEIFIDVWGINEASIKAKISPEGTINISQVGPVALAGLSIEQATAKLKKLLSQKYSLSGENSASQISVTLGSLRTVQINVLGEVNVPGTYRLSSLSTVFNALYRAGGVTEIGSLRGIQLSRAGKIIKVVDLYSFIFDGDDSSNVVLKDGDAIIVPPYLALVEVKGGFKRPMFYESVPDEAIGNMVRYAGGFTYNANVDGLTVERIDGNNGEAFTVQSSEFASFALKDGDVLTANVNINDDNFENRVEISGCVMRPGVYAIGKEVATVRQLVEQAGGLLENAFLPRAQLIREKSDRSLEVKSVAIGAIMSSSAEDIMLRKNDLLIVSDAMEMDPKGKLTITGYVANEGKYDYAEGISIEDLIMLAGGLKPGASTARIDVSRRVVDPSASNAPDSLAQVFSFEIKDGLPVEGTPSFTLEPYDVVSVRKSPAFLEQKIVTVSGEALFPGNYTLVSNNERVSDIFRRAGSATPNAYVAGAKLIRRFSEAEMRTRKELEKFAESEADSTNISAIEKARTYVVGIMLDKAVAEPGGEFDIILCDGDELYIPPMVNTVRIQGEVFYPNAVNYVDGENVSYYIRQGGGYTKDALRKDVFVVYQNGQVDRGRSAKVLPGCEIVVPTRPARSKLTVGEWIGIGTSAASLTTMIVTIANLIKK